MAKKIQQTNATEGAKVIRTSTGQFVKGTPPPNPTGAGGTAKLARERQKLLTDAAPEIVAKLVEKAKEGDGLALRLCAERLLPLAKAQYPLVELPVNTDPIEAAEDIHKATQSGIISADHAGAMLEGIKRGLEIKLLSQGKLPVSVIELDTGRTDETSAIVKTRHVEDHS